MKTDLIQQAYEAADEGKYELAEALLDLAEKAVIDTLKQGEN